MTLEKAKAALDTTENGHRSRCDAPDNEDHDSSKTAAVDQAPEVPPSSDSATKPVQVESLRLNVGCARTKEIDLEALRLGQDLDGGHISGKIGLVKIGSRRLGKHMIEVEAPWSIARRRELDLPKTPENRHLKMKLANYDWPVYEGEEEERQRDSGVADPLPVGSIDCNGPHFFCLH